MSKSVGIKELKNKASSIIDSVETLGETISVTRNNKEVARIVPISQKPLQKLIETGRVASLPALKWSTLEVKKIKVVKSAAKAIASIISDRDDE